tara:strand:+ start:552 stop:1361 length:810 start_codon:yes stop_codon:yes gene_type:complete
MPEVPTESYGFVNNSSKAFNFPDLRNEVLELGFSIIRSRLSIAEIKKMSALLDEVYKEFVYKYHADKENEQSIIDVIRLPLIFRHEFFDLIFDNNLLTLVSELINGEFILNQQNGLLNSPNTKFSQSRWHRDLPYQNFISSKPIAISCIFCIDDFTEENGATFVLPRSHKLETLPSKKNIKKDSVQLIAKSGDFIIMDSMLMHSAGINSSNSKRRGINQIFTIPYIKQQISLKKYFINTQLSTFEKRILGISSSEPESIEDYLNNRKNE